MLTNQLLTQREVSMIHRFENLTTGISQIYKSIQRIKKHEMHSFGLKGTHVMCLYFLGSHPDGLTAADLCNLCKEDKAGISRIMSDLEERGFISYGHSQDKKRYRAKAYLTSIGKKQASKVKDLILRATIEGGKGITEEERAVFYRVLFLISDNLAQVCNELESEYSSSLPET